MPKKIAVTVICLLLSCPVVIYAAAGDFLYVTGSKVNARSGPDTGFAVAAQLNKHTQVVEISRNGAWVEVGVLEICGIAWVHQNYLVNEITINKL